MARGNPSSWDMAAQNDPMESAQVERTLDAMAISLSRKADAFEAWKTIFQKPKGKNWSALWGGNPVRQQLCIVDSIWGSKKGGPHAVPDKRLDRLVMGTFSGAVDYLTAKKLREPLMGVTHGPIDRFVKEFGYTVSEMTGWESITV